MYIKLHKIIGTSASILPTFSFRFGFAGFIIWIFFFLSGFAFVWLCICIAVWVHCVVLQFDALSLDLLYFFLDSLHCVAFQFDFFRICCVSFFIHCIAFCSLLRFVLFCSSPLYFRFFLDSSHFAFVLFPLLFRLFMLHCAALR